MGIASFFSFGSNRKSPLPGTGPAPAAVPAPVQGIHATTMDVDSYLASDEKAWLQYLSQALRTYRKPGVTLKEEYHMWLDARARSRAEQNRVAAVQPQAS